MKSRRWASSLRPAPACPSASTTWSSGQQETLVKDAEKQVVNVQQQYLDGAITNGERYNKVIEIWSAITEKVADEWFGEMQRRDKEANSIRFTSWPTPAPADRNSRFASSPACVD